MGDRESLPKANGPVPNGLRPNEAGAVAKVLDADRWSLVEERTGELIARIQPNKPSEDRRIAVANYVQQLIMKCFPCQVFTFGSVPLKTYLPDGDIDLTAFSKNLDLKDTWANEVRQVLENEEKSVDAEFRVKEVQYIKAEVKIIKCLVENIVVDISFNQLGGLCTLCFLEEIDHLINQDHLFKRSIILIKAWCYYESRILGAHHGLLSTYALETLVLYIFHVFNNSFAGPLEVLYRFLEFFSRFDWENFCVSLWGPVPISSLPDTTAEPPRKDSGDLLLSRIFLDACSGVYAVFPSGHDTNGQPFVSKHFNVIDPLRTNNNLGRSVSKGNFYRICSALAFGAKRLAAVLECPKEDAVAEVDKFFTNTWRRHGSGNRPDAPSAVPLQSRSLNCDFNQETGSHRNKQSTKKESENALLWPINKFPVDLAIATPLSDNLSQLVTKGNQILPNSSKMTSPCASPSQKSSNYQMSHRVPDQIGRSINQTEAAHTLIPKSHSKSGYFSNDQMGQVKLQFARTHSSPELSDALEDISSHSRRNIAPDVGKNHCISYKPNVNIQKKYDPDVLGGHHVTALNESLSPKYNGSHQNHVNTLSSNYTHNNFCNKTGISTTAEEVSSTSQALEMHQEDQDLANIVASPRINGMVPQLPIPINLATRQLSVPSHILPPIPYAHKNIGVVPANVPIATPWNPQFPQGFAPQSLSSFFSNALLENNSEEATESVNDTSSVTELNQEDADHTFWPEPENKSAVGFIPSERSYQTFCSNENRGPLGGFNIIPLSHIGNSNAHFMREHVRTTRGNINLERIRHDEPTVHQHAAENDMYSSNISMDTRSVHSSRGSSSRSMMTDSWDESSLKAPKLPRDKWGRKAVASTASSISHGSAKSWQSYGDRDDHSGEWNKQSSLVNDVAEQSDCPSPAGSLQSSVPEASLMNGPDSVFPVAAPMFLYAPRQRSGNNSGPIFYPTGPLVPCYYMLPVYKVPSDTAVSDSTLEQFNKLDVNQSNSFVGDDANEKTELTEVPISVSSMDGVPSYASDELSSDILNGDFCSHWINLQYGRLCQDATIPGSPIYPSPVVAPQMYLQGHYPWDGLARPYATSANLLPVVSYSPRILQVMPFQPGSVRHGEHFQNYGDEGSSYRGGTGTFLPKAKVPLRDRQSSTRNHRASYNYERGDHGDREGSWINSKSRVSNRGHGGRTQHEKPNARPDRFPAVANRNDRVWDSNKNERIISNPQSSSLSSTGSGHGLANMTYGMHPAASVSTENVHQSGTQIPSFFMVYSYGHPSFGYGSSSEPMEFGSLGSIRMTGINEVQPSGNGVVPRNAFEATHETYQQGSECSSPDQPSSPHFRR